MADARAADERDEHVRFADGATQLVLDGDLRHQDFGIVDPEAPFPHHGVDWGYVLIAAPARVGLGIAAFGHMNAALYRPSQGVGRRRQGRGARWYGRGSRWSYGDLRRCGDRRRRLRNLGSQGSHGLPGAGPPARRVQIEAAREPRVETRRQGVALTRRP